MKRQPQLRRRLLAITAILSMFMFGLGTAPVAARNGAAVPQIVNSDRAQVAATYRSAVQQNLLLNPQWNGSAATCRAGTSSNTFDAATVETMNWFRSMAGLRTVSENTSQASAAQQTALMMHAQNALSHSPASGWSCYTKAGADAAGASNLTLGLVGAHSIIGQIEDAGAGNEALGHRRWLLFPELTNVGVANTSRASAIQVVGANNFGTRYSETDWVSWPPPGFVPEDTVYPRWSMSYAGSGTVNLSGARVTVTENGRNLQVRILPNHNGFGDPTLGWEVIGSNPTAPGDVVYNVNVTGVTIDGRATSRRYTVTSFDASGKGGPILGPSCQGKQATIIGTAGNDHLRGTNGVDVIVGLGGDDIIDGLAGNDIICGGAGNDLIRAGWGHDRVLGGPGRDVLRGARGNDVLNGGSGRDRLDGGPGADTLIGGGHSDTLLGGGGTDICWGRVVHQSLSTNDTRTCEQGR